MRFLENMFFKKEKPPTVFENLPDNSFFTLKKDGEQIYLKSLDKAYSVLSAGGKVDSFGSKIHTVPIEMPADTDVFPYSS